MSAADRERMAREALGDVAKPEQVGPLLGEQPEADGVHTLRFASDLVGYPGWVWTVSLAELDGEQPTVLETELMPGDGALLAPDWVPWSERLEEYRAAQAAAGELDETVEDDESDDDDDDHGDDPDDGIDFESALAVGEDEEDEPEGEADEDGPEPPAVAGFEDGREEEE